MSNYLSRKLIRSTIVLQSVLSIIIMYSVINIMYSIQYSYP